MKSKEKGKQIDKSVVLALKKRLRTPRRYTLLLKQEKLLCLDMLLIPLSSSAQTPDFKAQVESVEVAEGAQRKRFIIYHPRRRSDIPSSLF